ncbi:MAG: hypothetical protein RBT34_12915 [Anaerolineaceae bacterium]|jgi:1-deoxy-D-xylulose 5-phosphate reductoisomerase|nr:hypothetical protein [Anaerolineaceae bacterium]
MNLEEIIQELDLTLVTRSRHFAAITPSNGYASDLLSCVMAGAGENGIWVTLQAHANIVAVAALVGMAAVIITEDAQPDEATIAKANQENITLLTTPDPTYHIVGKLWEMGIKAA